MALVGIDLGTTNSLIAHFTEDGPKLIPNTAGKFLTPSAVGLSENGDVIVGQAAKYRLVSHPKHIVWERSLLKPKTSPHSSCGRLKRMQSGIWGKRLTAR